MCRISDPSELGIDVPFGFEAHGKGSVRFEPWKKATMVCSTFCCRCQSGSLRRLSACLVSLQIDLLFRKLCVLDTSILIGAIFSLIMTDEVWMSHLHLYRYKSIINSLLIVFGINRMLREIWSSETFTTFFYFNYEGATIPLFVTLILIVTSSFLPMGKKL